MTKNNKIKVTPTSRGNFSKLRKFKNGGHVQKMEGGTTENGIGKSYAHNTGYTSGSNAGWSESIFTPEFQEKLFSEIKNPNTTPERRKQLIAAINATQQAYEDLRKTRQVSNPAQFEKAVLEYLQRIINQYPDLNKIGIANGVNLNRYTYAQKRLSGDNAGEDGSWSSSADGIWGAQTNDRTILGYNGDWDESGDRFKDLNTSLKDLGYKVSRGLNGQSGYTEAYYINELKDEPDPKIPSKSITKTPSETILFTPFENIQFTPEKFEFKPLKDWNTAPLWNAAQWLNTRLANNREYNTLSQFRTPLDQAPLLHDVVHGDYTYQTAINDQKAKNSSFGNKLMTGTSDLTLGMQAALAANAQNDKLAIQAAEHQDLKYEKENNEAVQVANKNNIYRTTTANTNNERLKADWNRRLELKAKRDLKNAQADEENLIANRIDSESFNKMNWLNQRDQYNSALTNWGTRVQHNLDDQYINSQDLTKDANFQNLYNKIYDENGALRQKQNPEDYDDDVVTGYENWLKQNGKQNTISNFSDFAQNQEYWGEGNEFFGDTFNSIVNPWKKLKETAKETYLTNKNNLALYLLRMQNQNPLQYSGQHSVNSFVNMNPYLFATPSERSAKLTGTNDRIGNWYYKEGGTVFKKDRFLQYLLHNQKGEDRNRDRVLKYTKNSQDVLGRDLDALDKETLFLLKQIFK